LIPLKKLINCGAWFASGLAHPQQIRFRFKIILFGLSIPLGEIELAALSCSYFGFAAFGWCGKK
jgi:hypothetical protein